jgi:hypothetical protein
VREDPAFLNAVLLMESVRLRPVWIVPSVEFNRLVYHHTVERRTAREFRASPESDNISAFRVEPMQVGQQLLSRVDGVGSPPEWILSLTTRPPARMRPSQPRT